MTDGALSNRVYNDILGRILSGRMKPGEVFNRRQVAAELGVSVAPVLEAMLELESEGLIQTLPRRGTRVRLPGIHDVWGQFVLREALECQAARLYCGEPVRRHMPRLLRLAEALDRLDVKSVEYVREQIRFHHYLVSLANCPPLTEAFERVMKLSLLHAAANRDADPQQGGMARHAQLVQVLQTNDADAAEAAMRAHVHVAAPLPANDDSSQPSLPAWLATDV